MALSDVKLKNLKPRAALYRVADTNGLCIEVTPSGSKLWRYRYRYDGRASMLALGMYPEIPLAGRRSASGHWIPGAREKRDEARALLGRGINPSLHFRSQRAATVDRAANSFGAIAKEWFLQNEHRLTAGTLKRDRRVVQKDLALIRDLPVADLKASEVLAALRKIEARGTVETAHRARSLVGKLMKYAIATGRAERNPAADLTGALKAPIKQHFASITEPDKVADLLRAIRGYTGHLVTEAALKLAPLVFVRPGELRSAKWADIDLDAGEWRFEASKTKQPHLVPLSRQAIDILRDLRPLTGRYELVFPSIRSVKRAISENTLNAALRRLGYDKDTMTAHGFRAMARTILDEVLHFPPDIVEHQLAHAVRGPLGRAYNRTAHLPERRKMMQAWSDWLDSLCAREVTGIGKRPSTDVARGET